MIDSFEDAGRNRVRTGVLALECAGGTTDAGQRGASSSPETNVAPSVLSGINSRVVLTHIPFQVSTDALLHVHGPVTLEEGHNIP